MIAEKAGFEIEIIILPPKRLFTYFKQKRLDAVFPARDERFRGKQEVIKSDERLYVKKEFIFTKKGSPVIRRIKELEGKRVGLTLGYAYTAKLTENSRIFFDKGAKSDEVNVIKLMVGRIDAFVAEELSGLKAIRIHDLSDKIQYDRTSPISEHDIYYAFQNTDNGKKQLPFLQSSHLFFLTTGSYNSSAFPLDRINIEMRFPRLLSGR